MTGQPHTNHDPPVGSLRLGKLVGLGRKLQTRYIETPNGNMGSPVGQTALSENYAWIQVKALRNGGYLEVTLLNGLPRRRGHLRPKKQQIALL